MRRLLLLLLPISLGWFGWVYLQINRVAHEDQAQTADAIAVFGAAEYSGHPSPVLHARLDHAVALYKRQLAPGGVLAFHISNQRVDLEPEVVLLARHAGMDVRRVSSMLDEDRGEFTATWMLLTENPDFFAQPEVAALSRQPVGDAHARLWTDDYSSLLPLVRWQQ